MPINKPMRMHSTGIGIGRSEDIRFSAEAPTR
jgi:hypothetical protein